MSRVRLRSLSRCIPTSPNRQLVSRHQSLITGERTPHFGIVAINLRAAAFFACGVSNSADAAASLAARASAYRTWSSEGLAAASTTPPSRHANVQKGRISELPIYPTCTDAMEYDVIVGGELVGGDSVGTRCRE